MLDAALAYGVERPLFLGSSCIYPKYAGPADQRGRAADRAARADQRRVRDREIAGVLHVQAARRQHGTSWVSAIPTNLGPGDSFDPERSHPPPGLLRRFGVLQEFARRLRAEVRAVDTAGRWGGEEFLVVLPGADSAAALRVAERIGRATAATPVVVDGTPIPITVSGGCATGPADSPEAQVSRADAALYEAKVSGRNRILPAAP
jgi:nucleoside-diphosphate-sugar epimerase